MTLLLSPTGELRLRKLVEQAVRPVRASEQTKLRIRLEMLAHLTDIYGEELAKSSSEAQALDAAASRFGAPGDLTGELTRSLPGHERWLWQIERYERWLDRWFGRAQGEPYFRFAARSILTLTALNVVLFALVCSFAWSTSGRADATPISFILRLVPLVIAFQLVALLGTQFIESLTEKQAGVKRWSALIALALASSAVLLLCVASFWWSLTGRLFTADELARVAATLLAAVGGLAALIAFACDCVRVRKHSLAAWRQLELD